MMGKFEDLDPFTAERLLQDEPVDLDSVSARSPELPAVLAAAARSASAGPEARDLAAEVMAGSRTGPIPASYGFRRWVASSMYWPMLGNQCASRSNWSGGMWISTPRGSSTSTVCLGEPDV